MKALEHIFGLRFPTIQLMTTSSVVLLSGLLYLAPFNAKAACSETECSGQSKLYRQKLDRALAEINRLNFALAAANAKLAAKQQELTDALAKLNALTSIEQSLEEKPEGEQLP